MKRDGDIVIDLEHPCGPTATITDSETDEIYSVDLSSLSVARLNKLNENCETWCDFELEDNEVLPQSIRV